MNSHLGRVGRLDCIWVLALEICLTTPPPPCQYPGCNPSLTYFGFYQILYSEPRQNETKKN